ncbi:MAG TPA: hypothetical protein VD978_20575 [Azospirillum sp.]|nr:hypothetical protein [Azospirillum sp.]
MDGFALVPRGWGLYVIVRRTLGEPEREEFSDLYQRACWFLHGRGPGWGVVADLCGMPLDGSLHDRLAAPMHLARQHGAGRSAALVSDVAAAGVLADALRAAGVADRSRVFVAPGGGPEGLRRAHDWVLKGIEPAAERCAA